MAYTLTSTELAALTELKQLIGGELDPAQAQGGLGRLRE